jgi:hypothetical protein
MRRLLAALLAVCLTAAGLGAQAVETPEPFDSAGRVMVITPTLAADLTLRPPAWRIAGDYVGARLFRLDDSSFVITVERRGGAVERYSITAADREYLRERTRVLPPTFGERVGEQVGVVARETAEGVRTAFTERGVRNAFIRNQTLLGLAVYAPSFAYAITEDDAGRVASWLLVSGASYFGAATLTREMTINESQNRLATDLALRTAAGAFGLTWAFGAPRDGQALSIFLGGIGGTAAGLYFGRDITPAQIEAGSFASTASALVGGAAAIIAQDKDDDEDEASREVIATAVATGAIGYPLGLAYPRMVSYNVTAGDVNTLFATGALGMVASGMFIANTSPDNGRIYLTTLTGGFIGGLVVGDRLLVKRFDHTRSEAALVNLGAGAGALMGLGTFVLIDRERENNVLALALATVGGAGGIAATEYFLATRGDAGRLGARLQFNPAGLAMAAGRVRGQHGILRFEF